MACRATLVARKTLPVAAPVYVVDQNRYYSNSYYEANNLKKRDRGGPRWTQLRMCVCVCVCVAAGGRIHSYPRRVTFAGVARRDGSDGSEPSLRGGASSVPPSSSSAELCLAAAALRPLALRWLPPWRTGAISSGRPSPSTAARPPGSPCITEIAPISSPLLLSWLLLRPLRLPAHAHVRTRARAHTSTHL